MSSIVKNIIGLGTFAIGSKALYDACKGKVYSKYAADVIDGTGTKPSTVDKVALVSAQISFALSAAVTPLGIWGISKVVNTIFSSAQLEKVFGANTTFESNWKHPRHVVSLVAMGLAIPMIVKRFFVPRTAEKQLKFERYAYWTVLTSRPVLHLGNQLAQRIFK